MHGQWLATRVPMMAVAFMVIIEMMSVMTKCDVNGDEDDNDGCNY